MKKIKLVRLFVSINYNHGDFEVEAIVKVSFNSKEDLAVGKGDNITTALINGVGKALGDRYPELLKIEIVSRSMKESGNGDFFFSLTTKLEEYGCTMLDVGKKTALAAEVAGVILLYERWIEGIEKRKLLQ